MDLKASDVNNFSLVQPVVPEARNREEIDEESKLFELRQLLAYMEYSLGNDVEKLSKAIAR
jgi:hypothetical protein